MRFSLNTDLATKYSIDLVKSKIMSEARRYILLAPKRADEIALNNYIMEHYKKPLEKACLDIIYNCVISVIKDTRITITLKDKELEKLAELITFGTGKIKGSQLLVKAFKILETK